MIGVGGMNKKEASRFFTVFLMGLFIIIASAWCLAQMASAVNGAGYGEASGFSAPDADTSDGSSDGQVDLENLGDNLLQRVEFETDLSKIDDSVARGLVEVSNDSKLLLYMGSGSCSDQVILVASPDEKTAESDRGIVEQYLKDARKSFDAYIPKQAKKISDALIITSGCYIAVCVTDDAQNAKEMVLAAFE